ncbi:hypothetical protein FA13DRAFT_1799711 [Coprinellus micaceus]|jgi:hypothetical protein|uniref:Transcription activator GCR1-like domain-containing protein n=1 Tax=Coprinellus micaceus TaxID=71717 RepID=A0A4Y7SIT4_COPMI|nr:hypothetical protein FA13DRAFT_1799711 [Coprinellus micaceus]
MPVLSGNGNAYSIQTFPLSQNLSACGLQIAAITKLEEAFSPDRIRQVSFDWYQYRAGGEWDWCPEWTGCWRPAPGKPPNLEEIWRENRYGIGRWLSVQAMQSRWDSRWRRKIEAEKVEGMRRGKVITLIERVSSQNGWSEDETVKYLTSEYPIPSKEQPFLSSMRAFQKHLGANKDSGITALVEASRSVTIDP